VLIEATTFATQPVYNAGRAVTALHLDQNEFWPPATKAQVGADDTVQEFCPEVHFFMPKATVIVVSKSVTFALSYCCWVGNHHQKCPTVNNFLYIEPSHVNLDALEVVRISAPTVRKIQQVFSIVSHDNKIYILHIFSKYGIHFQENIPPLSIYGK
jgi:hypothetical protein